MRKLLKKIKLMQKSVDHPTQKVKQRIKKFIMRINKLPFLIRYSLGFILIGAGILSFANPLLPGWLLLLIGAKTMSPRYYYYVKRIFKKYQPKSYQQEIFDILSQ